MSVEHLLIQTAKTKILDSDEMCCPIDLSVENRELEDLSTASDYEKYIKAYLNDKGAGIAFGGYNEKRNLYSNSSLFNDADAEERNIHIGMDLWAKAGTSVLAPFDGKVHSFNYNTGNGNYGPTIILEHQIDGEFFYSLYGHLSLDSIEEIEIGDVFTQGQKLAKLGTASENGNYAPHLHFQLIKDIEDNFGDYPGVCSHSTKNYYLENCPNPNLLLKLNTT